MDRQPIFPAIIHEPLDGPKRAGYPVVGGAPQGQEGENVTDMEGQVNHRRYNSVSSPVSHSGSSHTGWFWLFCSISNSLQSGTWKVCPFSSVTVTKYIRCPRKRVSTSSPSQ